MDNYKLLVDIHSHLIPYLDDGAKNMNETINLLRRFEDLGYKKLITTPHIMADGYTNTKKSILEAFSILQNTIKTEGIALNVEVGAEYYLDDGFLNHLEEKNILPIDNQYLLFETSYISKPLSFDKMVYEIAMAGYIPVFAHPERYRYIRNIENEYYRMKERGILFQVNINSFGGYYGKDAQKKAIFLSEAGMIDFLGSDVHNMKQIETLELIQDNKFYQKIFTKNRILNNIL